MSPARLRALPPAPATAPDLLLRTFEPPHVLVRGQDLLALLAPAYHRLAVAGRASRWLTANRRSRTAADRAVPVVESMPGLRPIAVM